MTDTIEQKALALVNEVNAERGHYSDLSLRRGSLASHEALCRAIQQHEAFRQEVSDAVEDLRREWPEVRSHIVTRLSTFIIPKPVDPLVEVVDLAIRKWTKANVPVVDSIRAELDRLGYEIREKAGDD